MNNKIDPRFYKLAKRLWAGGSYGYYWTPVDSGGAGASGKSHWTTVDDIDEVPNLFKRVDTYFGVNPSKIKRLNSQRALIENIEAANCLIAEFDVGPDKLFETKEDALEYIKSLPVAPTVIIHSGGGYHCYWILKATYFINNNEDLERIKLTQYAWVEFVGGDEGAKDLSRVLRVPGSKNTKYDDAYVEIVEMDFRFSYDLERLESYVTDIIEEKKKQSSTVANRAPQPVDLSDEDLLAVMLKKPDIAALWRGNMSAHGDDHSSADQALCNHLAFYTGWVAERMDRMFRSSKLYRDKWEVASYRNRTIEKAIADTPNKYVPDYNSSPELDYSSAFNGNGKSKNGTKPEYKTSKTEHNPSKQTYSNLSADDEKLITEAADDNGNAQCVNFLHGAYFAFCEAYGYVYYNGEYWEREGAESELKKAITATLLRRRILATQHGNEKLIRASKPSATNVRNCLFMVKPLIEIKVEIFDSLPNHLNCKNGLVDLRTGEIEPHSPHHYLTYCVQTEYDPNADYVDWVEFLDGVVADPSLVPYLQEAVGYGVTGHIREECLFYLFGPTRSGKGTFTETILYLLSKPISIEADFKTFTATRDGDTQNFDLAPLKPCRFVAASESDKYETLNESKVKSVTGGNEVRCAFKRQDLFTYRPQFKIFLSSNHPPKGDVNDSAFWGRLRVISFPKSFLGKEDKGLKERLKSNENLKGVLNWIIQGSMRWYASGGGLETPDNVKEFTQKQRSEQDTVQQWIDECLESEPETWTSNKELYQSYKEYCQDIGIVPMHNARLFENVSAKGYETGKQKLQSNGKRPRGVVGLRIIKEF